MKTAACKWTLRNVYHYVILLPEQMCQRFFKLTEPIALHRFK